MGSRGHSSLSLVPVLLLLLLLLEVNSVNSFQQEEDDLTDRTKEESHRPLRRSKRRWIITTLELEEEDQGPFPKLVGELFNDMSYNMSLMYLISGPGVDTYPEIGLFSIEGHRNVRVYVHRPVDRETTPSFKVYFDIMDRFTGKLLDNSLIFNIRIRDVNDHAPQFPEKEFNISVKENHMAGQPIFKMLTVDLDEENTPNSQVLYFLISQTPSLKESGFQIDPISGEMQLSGCLDYETAPRFTLLVGAKDLGEPPLTSTATVHVNVQEGNNHRPTFTRENYRIQISEGRTSPSVLRLPVRDGDLPFTSAWRVRFHILNGNEEGHFDILTDPETNEGILNVIKPLDYETRPARSLVIAMENEELLFPCEGGRVRGPGGVAASATVSVQVMDTNDPPAFHPRSFVVSEVDGAGPGIQLGVFNATDPDRAAGPVRYKLAYDPASWVTVDELSGTVTTTQQIDRESPYVNHSFYTIIVQAVDDGLPPQTGTGTLMLFLSDVNDNAPALHPRSRYVEVCESALSETLLLQAEDADLEPYADPFTFELDNSWESAGDTWKLGESRGRSVELLMLTSLPPGNYSVPLFIRDKQGLSQKQTVHVRVCSCPSGGTCVEPSAVVTGTGLLMGALAPACAALVMLAATLLCLLRCCFVSEVRPGSFEEGQQTLIMYNDESKPISTQVVETSASCFRTVMSVIPRPVFPPAEPPVTSSHSLIFE
ncbi:cadherin-like protein 26 [Enhydra lutris kenyoni]|uniref:Cadherin-like protein 26 n=1 Tax=Enhydra lutris kenyoni TaxID=391180 RepID=A0A2Y9INP6_ENHLU|nr:cadherin-like protein 26 [Enhydra lutris kenyoni]